MNIENPCLRCPHAEECEMYDRPDDWLCWKDGIDI